jgi:phospholipase C
MERESKLSLAPKLVVTFVVILLCVGILEVNPKSSAASTATPIRHVVIIMQENHSFDNMFGTFPGLPSGYGLNLGFCEPNSPGHPTPCTKPWNADSTQATTQTMDIRHTRIGALQAYDNAKMDGFVANGGKNSMAYYTGVTLPYWWDYASYFTLNDAMMSSALSYSLPNHLYAVAAQAGAAGACMKACKTQYNLSFPQIGQSLTKAGVSWGYYQYNWNDAIDCTGQYTSNTKFTKGGGYDGYWSGLADFTQVQTTSTECSSLLNFKDLQSAIKNNNLPSVSWVIPSPSVSDHPKQATWAKGQQYIASIINSIEASKEWSSTVIFLTEDDWGGYYDNIVPNQIDAAGEGFRVPFIAISPYSIPGGIVHGARQEDFSAILSTIEFNWNIPSLGQRDAHEASLFHATGAPMLNFAQTPLKPLFLASSGVVYPLSKCTTACTYTASTTLMQQSLTYNAPVYNNTESLNQSLSLSGTGDPYD